MPKFDILMYHSVSTVPGPTSIAPQVFASQMAEIAASGRQVVSLDSCLEQGGDVDGPAADSVVITFDDGFQDFADIAWPIMKDHGFKPIVYIPTGHVGKHEKWRGANSPARRLMNWSTLRALADDGVDFGSHTVSHPNLQNLTPAVLEAELSQSQQMLEDKLSRSVAQFAPPYGLTTPDIRKAIAKYYRSSVGTGLGRSKASSDIFNLPRLEMFYFENPNVWRRHLMGRGAGYLLKRQALRKIRSTVAKPWSQF